ncbi:hypothetical protein ACFO0M_02945 [Micromonospora mangrovi]|uniref:PH domain-containing protein n=2 Tax=Micromonospora TaxID=1873 RepID=A0AAU7M0S3_9ACTN
MTVDGGTGQVRELLVSRVWPAVLVPAGIAVLIAVVGIALLRFFPYTPFGVALAVVIVGVVLRRDALLADETGLLVRRRGRVTRSYRWDEIRRAGLARPGFGQVALAVHPHGGPWDVPGPNSAELVGRVWMLRGPDRDTRDALTTLLRTHGVDVIP